MLTVNDQLIGSISSCYRSYSTSSGYHDKQFFPLQILMFLMLVDTSAALIHFYSTLSCLESCIVCLSPSVKNWSFHIRLKEILDSQGRTVTRHKLSGNNKSQRIYTIMSAYKFTFRSVQQSLNISRQTEADSQRNTDFGVHYFYFIFIKTCFMPAWITLLENN